MARRRRAPRAGGGAARGAAAQARAAIRRATGAIDVGGFIPGRGARAAGDRQKNRNRG